jgi:hypothetical protein
MKIATLTCIGIGLIGALMAGLTALGIAPGFVDFGLSGLLGVELGDTAGIDMFKSVITTACWGGLSLLVLLAAISFGVMAPKE